VWVWLENVGKNHNTVIPDLIRDPGLSGFRLSPERQLSMNIHTFKVGELQANCYFLVNDKDVVVIDPGDSADFLLEEISRVIIR